MNNIILLMVEKLSIIIIIIIIVIQSGYDSNSRTLLFRWLISFKGSVAMVELCYSDGGTMLFKGRF